ncbi:uncharacterized protein TNCT_13471 [Trichonephila clavata]|uniref:Uncharacterized protein n=1 Tax=Trichonephila clavata TaxID=2740835 RepID=A0A8X6LI30_TRICU|nr:uncharacterized protein TNCT_55171 [Trichonephila clavata]GFR09187.1 uncharacterized protein TNCT_8581 [Trichonephila clavata]GFR18335.1 uncharacterized protein TNCT_13471 [Trichonephila clavata]
MSKEYDETKVKPAMSTPQEPERTNGLKAQNVLPKKRKSAINFDDEKYGVKNFKIDQQFPNKRQESSKLRDFLRLILIRIRRFLAGILTSEKTEIISNPTYDNMEAHEKSQAGHSSKIKDETSVDDEHTKEVDSKLEKGNVEQVDNKKSR